MSAPFPHAPGDRHSAFPSVPLPSRCRLPLQLPAPSSGASHRNREIGRELLRAPGTMFAHPAASAPAPCPLVWPRTSAVGEALLLASSCAPLCSRTSSLQESSPLSPSSASVSLLGYFPLHSRGMTVTVSREEYHPIAFQPLPYFPVPSDCGISWKPLSGLPASRSSPPSPSWSRSTEGMRLGESRGGHDG